MVTARIRNRTRSAHRNPSADTDANAYICRSTDFDALSYANLHNGCSSAFNAYANAYANPD